MARMPIRFSKPESITVLVDTTTDYRLWQKATFLANQDASYVSSTINSYLCGESYTANILLESGSADDQDLFDDRGYTDEDLLKFEDLEEHLKDGSVVHKVLSDVVSISTNTTSKTSFSSCPSDVWYNPTTISLPLRMSLPSVKDYIGVIENMTVGDIAIFLYGKDLPEYFDEVKDLKFSSVFVVDLRYNVRHDLLAMCDRATTNRVYIQYDEVSEYEENSTEEI